MDLLPCGPNINPASGKRQKHHQTFPMGLMKSSSNCTSRDVRMNVSLLPKNSSPFLQANSVRCQGFLHGQQSGGRAERADLQRRQVYNSQLTRTWRQVYRNREHDPHRDDCMYTFFDSVSALCWLAHTTLRDTGLKGLKDAYLCFTSGWCVGDWFRRLHDSLLSHRHAGVRSTVLTICDCEYSTFI